MRRRTDLSSGWTSFEVIGKNPAQTTPFSDTLASSGALTSAANKISIVEEVGWPEAKRRMHYGNKGRPRIVKKDDHIWLLKCWPDCWRLYFYVIPKPYRYIVYLHAVCKKQDAEDPSDAATARSRYDDIQAGRSALTPFKHPIG